MAIRPSYVPGTQETTEDRMSRRRKPQMGGAFTRRMGKQKPPPVGGGNNTGSANDLGQLISSYSKRGRKQRPLSSYYGS